MSEIGWPVLKITRRILKLSKLEGIDKIFYIEKFYSLCSKAMTTIKNYFSKIPVKI
jgi:hypothetical protein